MKLFGQVQEAFKCYANGTHRVCTPEETLERMIPFMPTMGITRLANITGLDRIGLPVYIAVRPNSRALSTSQGKGSTKSAAKASALMESIEAWHGERIENPIRIDSYNYLSKLHSIVDVTSLELCPGGHLNMDRPMPWLTGEDLLTGRPMVVPYECVSTNFVSSPDEVITFGKSSNGLASGNHILEAVSHGLCEVIERDAVAAWAGISPEGRRAFQVNLDSVEDLHLEKVINRLTEVGLFAVVWQITTTIGIPVYTCELSENPTNALWRPIGMSGGHGCHLDPSIAMARAIHEAIQSRATLIAGSRDDMFPDQYTGGMAAETYTRWRESADENGTIDFQDIGPSLASETFQQDIMRLLEALVDHGISQVVAVNLTRADMGIPVTKVVVPGLRGLYNARHPDNSQQAVDDIPRSDRENKT